MADAVEISGQDICSSVSETESSIYAETLTIQAQYDILTLLNIMSIHRYSVKIRIDTKPYFTK